MSRLIMCRGLPASGKSTWATEQLTEHPNDTVIVDSDLIRVKMGGYSEDFNRLVRTEKHSLIRRALRQGKTVISTDPNLFPTDERALRETANRCHSDFEIKLFDTSVDECVRRDSVREKKIGEKAIRYWNERWLTYRKD